MLSFALKINPAPDVAPSALSDKNMLPAFPLFAFTTTAIPSVTTSEETILTVAPAASVVNTPDSVNVIVPAVMA